jgi:putative FmdB family regulatory protein
VPTYDYQCRACGNVTEVIHSMQEDGPSVCELCGGKLRRVLFPTGIIFKGSGFYRNDSRASASGSKAGSDTGTGSDTGAGSGTDGGGGTEKGSGSTTPEGGSSEPKTAPTDATST